MIATGELAEAAVLHALVGLGFPVLVPFGQRLAYDLLVQTGEQTFLRVQCKTARERDGCLIFNSCSTDHGQGRRDYRGRADVFGVFAPAIDRVYVVPVAHASTRATRLRLLPTRNGQQEGVRFARNYEIDRWLNDAEGLHAA